MKRILSITIILLVGLLALQPAVQAQANQNPQTVDPYWYWKLNTGKAFAASTADTTAGNGLAAGTHYLGSGLKFTGASKLSWVITVYDSANWDVYVDHRPHGGSTFTQVYADSVQTGADSLGTYEIPLRTAAIDRIGKNSGALRFRRSPRASGNGVSTPSQKFYDDLIVWKP